MKKLLATLLVIAMVAFLFGCNPATSTDSEEDMQSSEETASVEETQDSEETMEDEETMEGDEMTPKKGGTLVYNLNSEPRSLATTNGFPGMDVLGFAYEYLLKYDEMGEAQPWLAESYTGDPEALTYTFKIKQGVKFQDGSDLTAEVVAWNLNHYKENGALSTSFFLNVINAEAVDAETVVVNMSSWDALFPLSLARTCYIISQEAYEANGAEWFEENCMGTGPFKVVEWEHNVGVSLEAHKDYWGGEPYLDGIYMPIYTTVQVAHAALLAGEIDVFNAGWDTSVAAEELDNPDLTVVKSSVPGTAYTLCYNAADPEDPFSNELVRKAANLAIDNEIITEVGALGLGVVSTQWCLPGTTYYVDDLQIGDYNLEKAKELMAEAGYADGFTTELVMQQGTYETGAQIIAEQLAEIGITVELNILPPSGYVKYIAGWKGMILHPMNMQNGAPSQYMATFVQGLQGGLGINSFLYPDDINDTLQSAVSNTDAQASIDGFKEATRLIFDEYSMANIISAFPGLVVKNNYVMGGNFGICSAYAFNPEQIWLDK